MKRVISCILILVMFLPLPLIVYAEKPITIYLNGHKLISKVPPVIMNNSLYISHENLIDLGGNATIDQSTNKVSIDNETVSIVLIVDESSAKINGSDAKLERPARNVDGHIMLPLKFIAQQLQMKLTWDSITSSVFLYKKVLNKYINAANTIEETKVSEVKTEESNELPSSDTKTLTAIGSIQMSGNQLVIQASEGNIAYTSFYLTNPDRIVIDFPNSIIGSNLNGSKSSLSGVLSSSHPQIQKIRYAIFSNQPSTVRVTVELKQAVEYNLYENEPNHEVILVLKSKNFKVVIDPGHGGRDPGAIGASENYESAFTLKLSQKVYQLLEQEPQIQPYLTRNEDIAVSLDDRSKFANKLEADLFISLHGNTYTSGKIRGTETYYYRSDSKTLADILHDHVVKSAKFPDRKVRKEDYRVIKDTKMPAALIEIGYLTNKQDESQMLLDEFQQRMAEAIVAAIKEYLGIP